MTTKKVITEKEYWNKFYQEHSKNILFSIPSQFCCLMATEINTDKGIAEFGCGNGRDSIFLARHGFDVVAMDLSSEAITQNNSNTKDYPNIAFYSGDVSKQEDVNLLLDKARAISKDKNTVVYSRFFLHSLDDAQENSFLQSLSETLIKEDQIYFEFRTNQDENTKKVYENHFRRFVHADKFLEKLKQHGFEVNYHIEGIGMAKFKNEDPVVARFMATKV